MKMILVVCLFPAVKTAAGDACHVKHFANTSNPFQKFLLVMLTEQSTGREFICGCV